MKVAVPNTCNNETVYKSKLHKHITLYGKKQQQAAAVLIVAFATDMASTILP